MKSLRLLGLIALAAAALNSQPTNGPVYWAAVPPDCSGVSGPIQIANVGYSCYVSGTFVWLAAGAGWNTSIRVAAPAKAAIGVDYSFYDTSGNDLRLDTRFGSGLATTSGSNVNFALAANQPADLTLFGATVNAPAYGSTATGSVFAVFYCPDAVTCGRVLPQMLYSALPGTPWSISVPISWDAALWTQWSAEGMDDGGTKRVSLVVYNADVTAASFTVRVYDSTGALVGLGATPLVPPLKTLRNRFLGEGGTYGALLSDVIHSPLPSGVFKVLVDGGSNLSAVQVLQFIGPSATSLQVAYDGAPSSSSTTASVPRPDLIRERVASTSRQVFSSPEK
jgi:hypothetical protein